jgi:hypothetical protein
MGRRKVNRATRVPAFGIAILTPVLLAGAVAASPERPSAPISVAAPSAPPRPAPVPAAAAPALLAAPVAGLRIPATALSAYRKAEKIMAIADPDCGVSWNLLAGIGRIESKPANTEPSAVRTVSTRTPAPKKAPSATWLRFAADGDGDGKSDPQNPFDAALATARHLCSSGMDFRNQAQALTALMRYHDSMPFAQNVLGWAAAYATGTAPLNLPPIYGPVPVLGPYLPGIWGLSQATLVSSTQAGYLLPGAGAVAPNSVLLEQAPPPPPVVVPEPPTWVERTAAASVPAPVSAADTRGAAVAPQLALQGDGPRTEPARSYTAPAYTEPDPAPAPAPDPAPAPVPDPILDLAPEAPAQAPIAGNAGNGGYGGGRQSGRAQIDSAPNVPSQSSGTGDSGGGKSAGRERRGSRGN